MLAEAKTALIAAVVSGIVGLGFQFYSDGVQHGRTARLEAALAFTSGDSEVVPAASRYIQAMNSGSDLQEAQAELRSTLASEIARTQALYEAFPNVDQLIEAYQVALSEFASTLDTSISPTAMRPWAESFGRVVDARQALDAQLTQAARA